MSNQVPSSEASYISIATVTSINAWQKANDNNVKRYIHIISNTSQIIFNVELVHTALKRGYRKQLGRPQFLLCYCGSSVCKNGSEAPWKTVNNSSRSVSYRKATRMSGTLVLLISLPKVPSFLKLAPSQRCFIYRRSLEL